MINKNRDDVSSSRNTRSVRTDRFAKLASTINNWEDDLSQSQSVSSSLYKLHLLFYIYELCEKNVIVKFITFYLS